MLRPVFIFCCLLMIVVMPLSAASAASDTTLLSQDRPQVALVLSGGGARGLSHIGVLKVLDKLQVPVDCVVGTSSGALVGGLFATGLDPYQMEQVLKQHRIADLFDDQPPREDIPQHLRRYDYQSLFDLTLGLNQWQLGIPVGVSSGYKFELFLKEMMGTGSASGVLDFNRLPTPFRGIATDLETGEIKVFEQGDLARVMRASMSLPGIVSPRMIDGRLYLDGGLVQNFPVGIGREFCGDIIIAVNLEMKPEWRGTLSTSFQVISRSIDILTGQNVLPSKRLLSQQDVLIEPNLEGLSAADFDRQFEIIALGEQAAWAMADELSQLAVPEREYQAWLDLRDRRRLPPLPINEIRVADNLPVHPRLVLEDVSSKPGNEFQLSRLHRDITDIFGRGDFAYVDYRIVPEEGQAAVEINAEANPWGPGYLKFGMTVASDKGNESQINIATSYRRAWVNRLGGEWRLDTQIGSESLVHTEFIQPMQFRDGGFVSPYLQLRRFYDPVFIDDNRFGDLRLQRFEMGIDLGIGDKHGEVRFGPFINHIDTTAEFSATTPLSEPAAAVEQVGYSLHMLMDQLDDYAYPTDGLFTSLDVTGTRHDWGSNDEYTKVAVKFTGAHSYRTHTLRWLAEWGDELGGDNDFYTYDYFTLGGPGRLSGFYLDQLSGHHYNLYRLDYYYRLAFLPAQFGRGVFIGASLEQGRIADPLMKNPGDWIEAGSLYGGVETVLGKLQVSAGYNSLGQANLYVTLGNQY